MDPTNKPKKRKKNLYSLTNLYSLIGDMNMTALEVWYIWHCTYSNVQKKISEKMLGIN